MIILERNFIIMDYDISILKNNIKELMGKEEPKLTQTDLASIIGSTQSRVSKVLSDVSKDTFTLEQVIKIADFFEVSMDELLGRKVIKKETLKTLKDVCEAFFLIDEVCKINFFEEAGNVNIFLSYPRISRFLTEWYEIQKLVSLSENKYMKKMYASWKKEVSALYSSFPICSHSMEVYDLGCSYSLELLSDYKEYELPFGLTKKELKSKYHPEIINALHDYFECTNEDNCFGKSYLESRDNYELLSNALEWLDAMRDFEVE